MRISDWSSDVCSSDLGKILARLRRRDVEARGADDGLRRIILGNEDRHVARADADRVGRMLGIEFPRQVRRGIGVEAHRHRVIGRESGRARGCKYGSISVVAGSLKTKKQEKIND